MADHDHTYKVLFSHAEMVTDLIRGFVHEDWVEELDFSTLERVDATFITEELVERESDIIWRVRWGGERWLRLPAHRVPVHGRSLDGAAGDGLYRPALAEAGQGWRAHALGASAANPAVGSL